MKGCFHRLTAPTPTRMWINNPTVNESRLAIAAPLLVDELLDALPDFRRACAPDGLAACEYAGCGPVVKFRGSFCRGWGQVLEIVQKQRGGGTGA